MATSSSFGTCAKMLVACRAYHSVTAWVALLKFRKLHVVPLWLHCGGKRGSCGRGLLPGLCPEGQGGECAASCPSSGGAWVRGLPMAGPGGVCLHARSQGSGCPLTHSSAVTRTHRQHLPPPYNIASGTRERTHAHTHTQTPLSDTCSHMMSWGHNSTHTSMYLDLRRRHHIHAHVGTSTAHTRTLHSPDSLPSPLPRHPEAAPWRLCGP